MAEPDSGDGASVTAPATEGDADAGAGASPLDALPVRRAGPWVVLALVAGAALLAWATTLRPRPAPAVGPTPSLTPAATGTPSGERRARIALPDEAPPDAGAVP